MCLATTAVLAGAGGSLLGGIAGGNAAGYQAQVAANNATIARQNEAYAASSTSAQITDQGLKNRQQQGGVRAGLAANGLDVNSGSAVDVQQSQREIGALDAATVAARGGQAVRGYGAQAQSFSAEADLQRQQQEFDYAGGALGAAGKLAGGASSSPWIKSLLNGSPASGPKTAWMTNSYSGPESFDPDELVG